MSTLRAEAIRLVGTAPDDALLFIVNFLKKNEALSVGTEEKNRTGFSDSMIMPSESGVRLGLADGRYPSTDNFFKDDDEIFRMFEGDL